MNSSYSQYVLLQELKQTKDAYIISQGNKIEDDHVFIVKYSKSSFLQPEKYFFVTLDDYLQIKKPHDEEIIQIIMRLCKICHDYKMHPSCMVAEGITFNDQENDFQYPRQLISENRSVWKYNAFGIISTYVHQNQEIDTERKIRIQEFIETIVLPSSFVHKSFFPNQNVNTNVKQNGIFRIEDKELLQQFNQQKKALFEQNAVFQHYNNEITTKSSSYSLDELVSILRFSHVYKDAGYHAQAKNLFSYYHELIYEFNRKEKEYFDQQEPQEINVKISMEQIQRYLEDLTKVQTSCDGIVFCKLEQKSNEWFSQRKQRITASNFGLIKASASAKRRNNLVQDQINPKFFGNAATKYGIENESTARDKYIKSKEAERYEVREYGLLVDPDYAWIAGSPDGLVFQDNKKIGCIEIKCPYSIQDQEIKTNFSKLDFLQKVNGDILMKESHKYYAQCQGIMKLSKVDWCDFIIFTQVDLFVIRVPFNEVYVNNLYSKLHDYFFNHLLIENLKPCSSVNTIIQYMDEKQLQDLKNNNYVIKHNDYTKQIESDQKQLRNEESKNQDEEEKERN